MQSTKLFVSKSYSLGFRIFVQGVSVSGKSRLRTEDDGSSRMRVLPAQDPYKYAYAISLGPAAGLREDQQKGLPREPTEQGLAICQSSRGKVPHLEDDELLGTSDANPKPYTWLGHAAACRFQ